MSAPDTADTLTATAPEATPSSPDAPVRRRLLGSHGVLVAVIVLLAVIAVILAAMLMTSHAHRQEALDAVEASRSTAVASSTELRAAQHARITSIAELETLLASADAVGAVSGAGIDPAATAALAAARAPLTVPAAQASTIEPAGSLDVDAASARQLQDYAAQLDAFARRLDAAADGERAVVDEAESATASLSSALADYAAATAASGAAVLADRGDADDDLEASLQAMIDSLAATPAADLPAALAGYRAAVDAVIASSDAARAPVGSGALGSGFDDPTSLTVVVNKARPLPSTYAPTDLRRPAGVGNTLPLRAIAASAAERMAADMAAVGIQLRMSSGYRSYSRQQTLYNGFVAREGVAGADEHSARPGHSEHQTGLAADFDDGAGCNLNVCFQNTAGGRWLAENAWKYGFILRYGDGWQPTVGYRFEPWHYRFVGEVAAAEMHERGIRTLEEYAGLPAAPGYP